MALPLNEGQWMYTEKLKYNMDAIQNEQILLKYLMHNREKKFITKPCRDQLHLAMLTSQPRAQEDYAMEHCTRKNLWNYNQNGNGNVRSFQYKS